MSDITPRVFRGFVFLFCLLDDCSILGQLWCVFARTTVTWTRGIWCFLTWHHYRFRNPKSFLHSRGFFKCFQQQQGNWFWQAGKTIWSEIIYKKNFLLGGQTSWTNSSSQLVNLPCAGTLMKPLHWLMVNFIGCGWSRNFKTWWL